MIISSILYCSVDMRELQDEQLEHRKVVAARRGLASTNTSRSRILRDTVQTFDWSKFRICYSTKFSQLDRCKTIHPHLDPHRIIEAESN